MYKIINLEQGKPTADAAIRRLTFELARLGAGDAAMLIHGYGSSGKGGVLRTEVRKYLERQRLRGGVRLVVEGERFTIFEEDARKLLAACPDLRKEPSLERHNNGVTFVLR